MLSTKYEILEKTYDKQIRKECDKSKKLVESCFQEHFEDEYACKPFMEAFEKCVNDFTLKFKKTTKI